MQEVLCESQVDQIRLLRPTSANVTISYMTRTNDDKLRVIETRKGEVTSTTKHKMSKDEYRSRSRVMKELRHSATGTTEKSEERSLPTKKLVSRQILNAARLHQSTKQSKNESTATPSRPNQLSYKSSISRDRIIIADTLMSDCFSNASSIDLKRKTEGVLKIKELLVSE